MSTLFLVATPIGNLEDISARALRVLREVDLIAAEDTRHTGKLLSHFDIMNSLTSYYEHNKLTKLDRILSALEAGDVALVSDAGTPGLNDPGYELIRAAIDAGHAVSPVPGPSAPVAALVASGLPTDSFLYLGYLPRKSGERRQMLDEIADLPYTLVFLETPHRLLAALRDLLSSLGDRSIAVARELTKLHEEIYRGRISEAVLYFDGRSPKGEITLVIDGAPQEFSRWESSQVMEALQDGLTRGDTPTDLARQVSTQSGWKRREVYQRIIDLQQSKKDNA
jgi:16S rRNA (cytidine1402-2'-O)-methyltransferase